MAKEMAMMKRLLEEAGIKPIPEIESLVEIEVEKNKASKKRPPSGSPEGNLSGSPCTGSGTSSESESEDDPYG